MDTKVLYNNFVAKSQVLLEGVNQGGENQNDASEVQGKMPGCENRGKA